MKIIPLIFMWNKNNNITTTEKKHCIFTLCTQNFLKASFILILSIVLLTYSVLYKTHRSELAYFSSIYKRRETLQFPSFGISRTDLLQVCFLEKVIWCPASLLPADESGAHAQWSGFLISSKLGTKRRFTSVLFNSCNDK